MPASKHHSKRWHGRPAFWRRQRRGKKYHFMGAFTQTMEEFVDKDKRDARFQELKANGAHVSKGSTIGENNKALWYVVY